MLSNYERGQTPMLISHTMKEPLCHCAELNKIVEATMPVNLYDDRKVSLRRPHGNGDLDIVGASYTRRKANVTEALFTGIVASTILFNSAQ